MTAEEKLKEGERIISAMDSWRNSVCSSDIDRFIRLIIREEAPSNLYREHGQTQCALLDNHFLQELRRKHPTHITVDDGEDYETKHMSRIDDLTTDQWGGAGPDCRTKPVLAGRPNS